jgi:hypothetical protein
MCTLNFERFPLGGRAGSVFLEQRVHNVTDGREQSRHNANNVPCTVSHLQRTLEPNHSRARLQRAQDLHGNEFQVIRRTDRQLQSGTAEVSMK